MAEPGRIEIQLSLLSGEDTAAAKDLAKSIKEIADSFRWLRSADYKQSAENLSRLYDTIKKRHDEVTEAVLKASPGTQGGASRQAAEMPPRYRPTDPARWTAAEREQAEREENERKRKEYEERAQAHREGDHEPRNERQRRKAERDRLEGERERQRELADQLRQAQADRERERLRPKREGQERVQRWMDERGVPHETTEGDGGVDLAGGAFRIPRFGQLNIQDILNRFRDAQLRRIVDTADPTSEHYVANEQSRQVVQNRLEKSASNWQTGSEWAGRLYAARFFMRQAGDWASQQGINPFDYTNQGMQLGYARNNSWLSQVLGVQTPFNQAAAEGARQSQDLVSMRFQAGINNEQAQQIVQATAGAGFSGNLGHQVRMDLMAPLFRRYGMDPNEIVPFLQVLRTGTGNIQDLNNVLGDMGEVARSANLTLAEYNKNLAGSVEATQALGGSALRGAEFGRTFMEGTGLPSNIGDQLSQNPLVQSFTAAQTGIPGMAQGALPATQRMMGIRATVNMLENTFSSGFAGQQGRQFPIVDPKTGRTIAYQQSGNLGLGAAANYLGMSPDALQKLMNTEQRQAAVESFNAATEQYQNWRDKPTRADQRAGVLARVANNFDRDPKDLHWSADGRIVDQKGKEVANREGVVNQTRHWREDRVSNQVVNTHDKKAQFGELRRLAREVGVDQHDIDKVKKGDTKKLRQLVSEASREAEASYQIAMTPLTKKFFKVLANEQHVSVDWNADSRNTSSAIPPGPAPLSPQTNTGAGPIKGPG